MKTKFLLFAALGLGAMLTACDKENENPTGSWVSAAPQSVTSAIADASSATKTVSIDFAAAQGSEPGVVTLTADYDVTAADSVSTAYTVQATVKGTWAPKDGDDDEYILTFDKNSVSVSGTDAPILGPVTDEFISSLTPLTKIEDVKVSKDGKTLTFEAGKPEAKYIFAAK